MLTTRKTAHPEARRCYDWKPRSGREYLPAVAWASSQPIETDDIKYICGTCTFPVEMSRREANSDISDSTRILFENARVT